MKGIDHHAISRSIAVMAFDMQHHILKKRHQADDFKLAEIQQQAQIDVSGTGGVGAWTTKEVHFDETFYYAPGQRLNQNEDPQVAWGAVLDEGRAFFSVHVEKWLLDTNSNYTGAVIAIGAQGDGSKYRGTVHVCFQGYGAPNDDPGFDEGPS